VNSNIQFVFTTGSRYDRDTVFNIELIKKKSFSFLLFTLLEPWKIEI